ncbi:hypothetical protein FA95DRAFT_1600397 [Auriscalpium vulgare]|uniref:Uncharacterized protein n=1 Tax=Auriscalpium vulgare TaxID=40419 RepID=A0ACB8SCJ6_9AGAM|nr:hypothetical protein FA95DRAFT_1600397 [Auriscalpium vulgare]
MQAQATRQTQDTITAPQSLQTVQTLLRAGLGCIAYLRDLLPQENFSRSLLTSANSSSLSTHASDSSTATPLHSESGKTSNVSGFQVMTVARGWSAEGDRLLDYMDGIFDALERQYLRSFIFAIYLDGDDPNNIVEAYTFNFKYHRIPGTDAILPIMTLGEGLMKMSLEEGRSRKDPVIQATTEGRPPTLSDVKKSLKSLIKVLINATTQMDTLPKQRFATFKTFYYPHTPSSYEPPHFRAGDCDKDRWFFTTHQKNEVPERCSLGKLETGYHGVNVHIASVSAFIPSSTDDNDAPFTGTTDDLPQTPFVRGVASRQAEIEVQQRDAHDRKVVWDAEMLGRADSADFDAEGEVDPECQLGPANDSGIDLDSWIPLGVRRGDGEIVPLSLQEREDSKQDTLPSGQEVMDLDEPTQELIFGGQPESVPECIQQLNTKQAGTLEDLSATQRLSGTEEANQLSPMRSSSSRPTHMTSPLPPSDFPTHGCSQASITSHGLDTQMVIDAVEAAHISRSAVDEILNMETQLPESGTSEDPIESYSFAASDTDQATPTGEPPRIATDEPVVLDCDCGVHRDDNDIILCEGGCDKWFHMWCMGYHSTQDKRLPHKFLCFRCRLRNDENWEMIMVQEWYQELLVNYSRLALFRRAIKIAETREPDSSKTFGTLAVAAQLFKRLETEGFIEPLENLDAGITDTRRGKGRGKSGKGRAKPRKNIQKPKHVFVKTSKRSQQYLDYFDPSTSTEMRVMGMDKLASKRPGPSTTARVGERSTKTSYLASLETPMPLPAHFVEVPRYPETPRRPPYSQTQDETQTTTELKRKSPAANSSLDANGRKKMKMSMAPPVDLNE